MGSASMDTVDAFMARGACMALLKPKPKPCAMGTAAAARRQIVFMAEELTHVFTQRDTPKFYFTSV